MKLRIEMSCTDFNIDLALREARTIMESLKGESCQVKVFHSDNREADKGHSWVTLTSACDINDKIRIYRLERELKELKGESV